MIYHIISWCVAGGKRGSSRVCWKKYEMEYSNSTSHSISMTGRKRQENKRRASKGREGMQVDTMKETCQTESDILVVITYISFITKRPEKSCQFLRDLLQLPPYANSAICHDHSE